MKIDVVTLFPDMVRGGLSESIIKRAMDEGHVDINLYNYRDYTTNKHGKVDDAPYGGGAGLVMQVEPVKNVLEALDPQREAHVIYFSPKGKTLNQTEVERLSKLPKIIMLCGHYEGFDQRIIDTYVDEELSIGDYVLTGGELAAMVTIDATVRLREGVLGKEVSHQEESFEDYLLEYPHYTRPETILDQPVPQVLMSGHHQNIADWRYSESLKLTYARRKDLFGKHIALIKGQDEKAKIKRLKKCLDMAGLDGVVPLPDYEKKKKKNSKKP